MGIGASVEQSKIVQEETEKPVDASDVDTPRGESAKEEVRRLRKLLSDHSFKEGETATEGETVTEGETATEETPAEETATEEAPAEETATEETATEEAPAEETATEEPTATEEAPTEES